jgi:YcxB-like protein
VSESIQLSFEYSFGDLKESIKQHLRAPVRRASRIIGTVLCIGCWLGLGFLALLFHYAGSMAGVEVSLMFVVVVILSIVNVTQYPWVHALLVRKRYRHLFGKQQEWQLGEDRLSIKSGEKSQSTGDWSGLTKAVRSKTGVLLYHSNGVFNWLPQRGFGSEQDIAGFLEMARINKPKIVLRP